MEIYGLNTLDFLLIFGIFVGGLIGMLRGPFPQLISAASIWLALLISLWTYRLLSENIFLESEIFGRITSDAMAFMIMFIVGYNAIRFLIRYLTRPPEEKKKKPRRKGQVGPIDEKRAVKPMQRYVYGPLGLIGGAILGVILATVWTAIFLGVMQFFFQVNVNDVAGVSVPGSGLVAQLRTSSLVPFFNRVLYYLVISLDLFVLDDRADILKRVVCTAFPDSC
jgi:hypothetical protein